MLKYFLSSFNKFYDFSGNRKMCPICLNYQKNFARYLKAHNISDEERKKNAMEIRGKILKTKIED